MPIEKNIKIAKKSLSQNFLKDKNIAKKIVNFANIKNNVIVEIGPGEGFLTDFIVNKKPKELYLVEKDNELAKKLSKKYQHIKNVFVVNKDIMKYDLDNFKKISVLSNLPYNISTKIIIKLFKNNKKIKEMILMLQKEVASKFDYKIKKLNKYKFMTAVCSNYSRLFNLSKNVFYPKPKVDSSVVKFVLHNKNINWIKIEKFINIIFKNKRKKLSNKTNIKNSLDLEDIFDKRIDEITLKELFRIYNIF